MSLHERLVEFLQELDLELPNELKGDTSLIKSGIFDSLSLFRLAAWIEQESGETINPATVNLIEEWDTINDILKFVERQQRSSEKVAEVKSKAS